MASRDFRCILASVNDGIATITLNRPEKKNALSASMVNELLWALDDAKQDPKVRVIVLRGAGKTFCAGADLKDMAEPDGGLSKKGDFDDLLLRFAKLGKPTIASIEGYVMGGGVGLVASCDFSIASDDAVFATPEITRGLFPMMIMAVLERVVTRRNLLKMMLLGERFGAAEALDYQLISEALAPEKLEERVAQLAAQLSKQSPTAMRLGLEAFHSQQGQALQEAIPNLRRALQELLQSKDGQEGLRAFAEKREPKWAES